MCFFFKIPFTNNDDKAKVWEFAEFLAGITQSSVELQTKEAVQFVVTYTLWKSCISAQAFQYKSGPY